MTFLKNKIKAISFISIIFIPIVLIYTLLVYLEKIPTTGSTFKNITFIISLIVFILFGLASGKIESKKGWLAGLTSALIIFFFSIIIKLLCNSYFDFPYFLKYACYLSAAVFGGIIGINLKKN